MFWKDDAGASTQALLGYWPYPQGYPFDGSNYVNVTVPLRRPHTRVAYVFHGPGVSVRGFEVRGDAERVDLRLDTAEHGYTVHLLTAPLPSRPLYAMVLRDRTKVVFEKPDGAEEAREEEVQEVEEYVNVVEDHLQHALPVFQQMERHILGRAQNSASFRKTAERLLQFPDKKKTEETIKRMFGMSRQLGGAKGSKKDNVADRLSESLPDIFAQAELSEKKRQRQRSPKRAYEDADAANGDSRAFIEYADSRKNPKDAFVKGRKFKQVHVAATSPSLGAGATTEGGGASYIRLFLIVNTTIFFLLLAGTLLRLPRGQRTQKCFYGLLLLDSFVLLYLYTLCSRTQC